MTHETADAVAAPPTLRATLLAGDELRCPLCRYDLRGQSEPRCPECGYRFTWEELTDPTLRLHPYLFEHHPGRNVRSFGETLLGGLRPRRFWREVYPTQPSRPRRLLVYWLLAAVPLLAAICSVYAIRGRAGWREMAGNRAGMLRTIATDPRYANDITRNFGSIPDYFATHAPPPGSRRFYQKLVANYFWRGVRPFDKLALALFAWPWLTALALMVFRISMRRARIRPVHVMRCVLYSADVVFWAGAVIAVAIGYQLASRGDVMQGAFPDITGQSWHLLSRAPDTGTAVAYVAAVVGIVVMTYRLTVAFRHYLRFDRPVATVLASQAIVFLVVLVVMVNWGMRW